MPRRRTKRHLWCMSAPSSTGSCPKCGATSLQAVPLKRSSVAKATATEYFYGTAPGVAASSDTVIQNVCRRCGCRWIPRTREERRLRALSGQLGPDAMLAAQVDAAAERARPKQSAAARIPARVWVLVALLAFVLLLVLVT